MPRRLQHTAKLRMFRRPGPQTSRRGTALPWKTWCKSFLVRFTVQSVGIRTDNEFLHLLYPECTKPKLTWILLKLDVDSLLANFAFPLLTFTSHVRGRSVSHVKDEVETFSSPISGTTAFINTVLCSCLLVTSTASIKFQEYDIETLHPLSTSAHLR